jgi:hypothetical protein
MTIQRKNRVRKGANPNPLHGPHVMWLGVPPLILAGWPWKARLIISRYPTNLSGPYLGANPLRLVGVTPNYRASPLKKSHTWFETLLGHNNNLGLTIYFGATDRIVMSRFYCNSGMRGNNGSVQATPAYALPISGRALTIIPRLILRWLKVGWSFA